MPKLVLCPSGMPSKKYPYFSKRKPRKMAKEKNTFVSNSPSEIWSIFVKSAKIKGSGRGSTD